MIPKEKEKKKTAVTTSLKIIEKEKKTFFLLLKLLGIFVGFVGIENIMYWSTMSFSAGPHMWPFDDHEEDGNDEF